MTTPGIREARLRPAYSSLYPDLKPDVWLPACALAEFVLERGLYQRRSGPPAKNRLLNESHFEFRGGPIPTDDSHRSGRIGDTSPTSLDGP